MDPGTAPSARRSRRGCALTDQGFARVTVELDEERRIRRRLDSMIDPDGDDGAVPRFQTKVPWIFAGQFNETDRPALHVQRCPHCRSVHHGQLVRQGRHIEQRRVTTLHESFREARLRVHLGPSMHGHQCGSERLSSTTVANECSVHTWRSLLPRRQVARVRARVRSPIQVSADRTARASRR